jgi:DNA-binding CsgD family transcriptional regulator/tetratricopeptide (TPR) repeat protein
MHGDSAPRLVSLDAKGGLLRHAGRGITKMIDELIGDRSSVVDERSPTDGSGWHSAIQARPLLERASPLSVLFTALSDAEEGQGSVVLVTGDAGIGKASLVRAFYERLDRRARVLVGGCDDLSTPRTLGPLRDAAHDTGGPLERALSCGASEAIFAAAIEELTGPPPTVLVVEDVHWADDATLDVLGYLARRVHTLAAMLVLTVRDEEVTTDHPVARMLGQMTGIPTHRLALSPLSPAAVATLAAGTSWDGTALHALTGGNPFFVTELLASVHASDGGDALPVTVADAVLARCQRLGADTRATLECLSVIPGQVGFDLAEALLGDRLDCLAEAERHGILEVRGDGLAFRHELARRAVERSLPAILRRTLNRTVVTALLARDVSDLGRLVHHAVEGGVVDAIVAYAPRAGREAARAGSHRQALAHFESVLRHADRLEATEHARIIHDYAWELHHALRFDEAVRAGREAVARYTELGDPTAAGEAMVGLSAQLLMAGEGEQAARVIEEARTILETAGSPSALAYALTHYGVIVTLTEASGKAVPVLEHARGLAIEANRPDLAALCLIYLGLASPDLDVDERIWHLRNGLAATITTGDHECAGRAYYSLSLVLYSFGRWDELTVCLADGLAFATEWGLVLHTYLMEVGRCLLLMRRGDWMDAEHGLRAALGHEGMGLRRVLSTASLGRLLARRGDPEAERLLTDAWQQASDGYSIFLLAFTGLAYAEWGWLTGQPDRVAEVQQAWAPHAEHATVITPLWAELLRYAARAGLPAEPFDGCPEPWAAGLRGDWRTAADAWERLGDPYERALELAESGEVEPTLTALRILDDLGACAAAALIRRRLKGLGVARVPRGLSSSTRANPAGLTDRQLDVLMLLADGLTNAEIAARLVLSVRTVEHHVAAILTKLGVPSRREAAAVARSLR